MKPGQIVVLTDTDQDGFYGRIPEGAVGIITRLDKKYSDIEPKDKILWFTMFFGYREVSLYEYRLTPWEEVFSK